MIEMEVRAAAFDTHEDLEADVLVLAEREHGEGRRLELQRPLDPTEDDRRLGMDIYCLVDEAGATHYGGVTAWSLDGTTLRLGLTSEAADVLGAEGGYLITLAGPAAEARKAVERGLASILGSSPGAAGRA